MSVHSSLHFTLYGNSKPRVGLRLNNGSALLEIDTHHEEGSRGGFCVSGPPDRVLRVIEAVAALADQCLAAIRMASTASAPKEPPGATPDPEAQRG